jgi:hypothetical protein
VRGLITFNWDRDAALKRGALRRRFFGKFDAFLAEPRHPKWREVNFAATLEGWQRSPAAQAGSTAPRHRRSSQHATRDGYAVERSFDAFRATAQAGGTPTRIPSAPICSAHSRLAEESTNAT